jgi:apolipoprotein N-acyltransferase
VYLVRAANTGISGFIAPTGKLMALVTDTGGRDIFIDGYLTRRIYAGARSNAAFYAKSQDLFIVICILLIIYGIITTRIFNSNKPE